MSQVRKQGSKPGSEYYVLIIILQIFPDFYTDTIEEMKKIYILRFFPLIIGFFLLLIGCKSQPETLLTNARLNFDFLEADNPTHIFMNYLLEIEKPAIHNNASFTLQGWNTIINGVNATIPVSFPDNFTFGQSSRAVIPIGIELDIPALIEAGVPIRDDFTVDLVMDLNYINGSASPASFQVRETVIFPYIREPVFTINAIAILRAELINTRFRVTIRIDNPNPFDVNLSSFEYELHGNGMFWADGTERDVLTIPAKSSVAGNLFLMMNFIDMSRGLLDQVIRLQSVSYRFNGNTVVGTGVDYLPSFTSEFRLSGISPVYAD